VRRDGVTAAQIISRVHAELSSDTDRPGSRELDSLQASAWYHDGHVEHETLMDAALEEARRARDAGEVPIGAVVAVAGEIVGRGFNQPIGAGDPTAHAEIVAIREAARRVGNYRLTGATLCVTIEPCLMCVGALVHARIGTLVYGAAEPKSGAVISIVRGGELPGLNHRFDVVSGVREDQCRDLVQAFFKERRGSA
jgi:tRNA(adenine34) deaminase